MRYLGVWFWDCALHVNCKKRCRGTDESRINQDLAGNALMFIILDG
jgi:hypothetical protein